MKKCNRFLSILLAFLLVLGDPSIMQVNASGTVSGSDSVAEYVEFEPAENQTVSAGDEAGTLEEDILDSEIEFLPESTYEPEIPTVSGNVSLREPEDFYEEPAPENYGTLAAYDEYSRTYHVDGNQYVTVIGNDGNTYLDDEGKLQQVDNTLVENPMATFSLWDTGASYINSANDYLAMLNGTVSEGGDLLTIVSGDYMISMAPTEGSFQDGVVKDNAIRYNNVFPEVDFQYTIMGNSVKEDIILLSPQAETSFSYKLNTYGLQAELINNMLYLYEEGTEPLKDALFILDAPEMEDAAGEVDFGVKLSAETMADGVVLMTVTPDAEWLSDAERVYPVRVDPSAIQINGSAIRMACVEEGSANTAIGDNGYPYVGYDDGITSKNLKYYNSKHLNTRTYFEIDYDFAALAAEPEIVSAALQVTQKTRWSKGTTQFIVAQVADEWGVNSITWNSQESFTHESLSTQMASASRGEALTFDVTNAVSAWVNGTAANNGLVMKASLEAANEETGDLGVSMQCEVFYNNSSASYGPKLIVSWTGELNDLSSMTLDDITIQIYPVVERNDGKSSNTLGVVAHGMAKPGSTVTYQLVNGTTGSVEAQTELMYPDSSLYAGTFTSALAYNRRLSNWQSEVFSNLTPGQVYYITATASEDGVNGATVVSDTFLIYEEGAFDLLPRIANHYGVELDTILGDMRMQDCLTKQGNRIFIRNPRNTTAYTAGELSEYYKAVIDGLLLGRAENCVFGYEPINLNTGNFYMEQEDVSLLEIGGTFSISRQYNSKGAGYKGSLGYGWTFAYDERMGELADGSIIWAKNDGNIITFTKTTGGYQAPAGQDYELSENENGYSITDLEDGSIRVFDTFGLLTEIQDVYGNTTTLLYDMEYRLKSIITPSGKEFKVSLDGEERITGITQPDGYGVNYAYDAAGNLIQVTNPAGNTIRFEYDASHRMTAWYDENGHKVVENVYDGQGRVTRQTDAEGGVVTLAYEGTENGGCTIATDAEGNVTTYSYDTSYRTTNIVYPDGTSEARSYNGAGYLSAVTDRMGVTTTYIYDEKGNLLTEKRQDGAIRTYTYNGKNQVTSVTEYDGGVTTYTYNEKGLLTAITDSEQNVTAYTYDEQNRLVAETDANGNITSYIYDGACVVSMIDAASNVWKYAYDAMNRMVSMTDPKGQIWSNTYDAQGRLIAETDPAGGVTLYTFDKAGAVTAITDKEGNTSTFTYDKLNRILSGLDPLGNTLTYTYDKNGNKLTETDAEGSTITYEYDATNRISAVTDGEGNRESYTYNGMDKTISLTDRKGNTTTAAYDAVKQVLASETDKECNVTSYETDILGRIIKITYADGSSVSYTWNKLSQLVSTTNQLGLVTVMTYDGNGNVTAIREGDREYRYAYDALNRVIRTIDPLGNVINYTYDAIGNVVSVTDGKGNTTAYTYDALNRLTALTDALGGVTAYTYDKESRVLSITAPEGDTTLNNYDAIGQLTAQKDAAGNVTTYTYDGVSRLLAVTDALKGVTGYTYDSNDNLLSATDALGNTHTYTVDAVGNLVTETYPNGEQESYTYDKNGNVLTYTDRYGIVTTFTLDTMGRIVKASDTAGNAMTYTYDAAGNLLTQIDVLGRCISYTYDVYGRPVAVTEIDGATTVYEYDALDRLVKVTDAEGKVTSYEYDAAGNLVYAIEPGEAEYTYVYDALNRLTQKVDPVGAATTFVYDKNSNLTQTTDGNGVVTGYAYDALNRLTAYTDGNGEQTVYAYDALSRLISITTPEGLREQYGYDAVGNLLTVTDSLGQTTGYSYDKLYRLVQSTSPMGAVETYTYDSHDVVTSVTDALGAVTTYKVNANGQVTEKIQANGGSYVYTYDEVQRLTSITTPLGYETDFTYSTGNDILKQTDSLGRTTGYEYDIMHRMTAVTDAEGGVTTYEYDTRGNQSKVTNALGYSYSYTYDKVDRMTTVTDPEEKVTALLYDMVGNVTSITTPGERTTTYSYDNNYNTVSATDPMGYVYSYGYDRDDRLTGTTDPLQQTTAYTYDAVNRLTAYVDKMGLTESYAYDAHGNVIQLTATDGLVTNYTYDLKNRLTSVTDPMGSTAYYTYDVMDNLTAVTDYMGRGTSYTYDIEGNLTSITDANGRTEVMTYDVAGRITSYTSNGGNKISYDYDKLDNLVEKSYENAKGKESAEPVTYAYDANGQRVAMYDSTGDTEYTYDALGRITSVTTYRVPERCGKGEFSHDERLGDTVGYTYDEADNLSIITYPDGTTVSYEYDLNDNLIKVTDREGQITTYEYDALNRVTAMHRPNGISTYNTYNARDQITVLENKCDDCDRIISSYTYTYDDRGYIVAENALEYLADSAEDEWNACGHGWGCGHWHGYCDRVGCSHKDGECDKSHNGNNCDTKQESGRTEISTNIGSNTGTKQDSNSNKTKAANSCGRENCKVNNEVAAACVAPGQGSGNTEQKPETEDKNTCQRPDGEHRNGCCDKAPGCHGNHRFCLPTETNRTFTYDDAGKLIGSTESGKGRCSYTYTYEYDLMGNRTAVCKVDGAGRQVEKETYTYNDSNQLVKSILQEGKKTTCTYYGYDKDGNLIYETTRDGKTVENTRYTYTVENRLEAVYEKGQLLMAAAYDGDGNRVFQLNYNPEAEGHCRTDCGYAWNENHKDADEKNSGTQKGDSRTTTYRCNDSGVLFPEDTKSHKSGYDLLYKGSYDGKRDDYELIEYINDVNREYTEVLVEQSICGRSETSYVYGVDRLSMDSFTGHTGYYLYDPRGSVTGITGECGHLYQSYQYSVIGEITFGEAKHQNEYTYNGESYNPNIESQYLRARYYYVVTATFLTEDSYLGDITEPLTLNRYNYCVSSYLNYQDPSGKSVEDDIMKEVMYDSTISMDAKGSAIDERIDFYHTLQYMSDKNATYEFVINYSYDGNRDYLNEVYAKAAEHRWNEQAWIEIAKLNSEINYTDAEDIMKPDTPLYKYTEENVNQIVELNSKFDYERDKFKEAYLANESRYKELADKIGVPPELIAMLHYRENTKDYLEGSFGVYLHNGEQLGKTTQKHPKGLYFVDFDLAAEDAIKEKQGYIIKYNLTAESKDIVAMMCFAEVYNGLGYYNNGRISPYLYSGTNLYTSGKYVEERNAKGEYVSIYKEDVVDEQIGAYILLNAIINIDEE